MSQEQKVPFKGKHREWTTKEYIILRENFPVIGCEATAALLGRSTSSCYSRAQALGLCGKPQWTSEEDAILKEKYPVMGLRVANLLPNRTENACKNRANKLGLSIGVNFFAFEPNPYRMQKTSNPAWTMRTSTAMDNRRRCYYRKTLSYHGAGDIFAASRSNKGILSAKSPGPWSVHSEVMDPRRR